MVKLLNNDMGQIKPDLSPNLSPEMARKQVSEYAMAFDLLSKITYAETEKDTIENILEIFTTLFSPQKLFYVSLKDGLPGQIYSTSPLAEDDVAIKNRLADFSKKYAQTASAKGFLIKISHKGTPIGFLEADALSFPEYTDHYLNLALSISDLCGLAIENARKNQTIKESEQRIRKEKEKLEEALAKVKKLSGLLPICSHCMKIRDDKGYWQQIESYIQDHSDAEFSHSICQGCAEKHYPDLDIYGEE